MMRCVATLAVIALALTGCATAAPGADELAGDWTFDASASDGFDSAGTLTLDADGTFEAQGIPLEVLDDSAEPLTGTWEVTQRTDTGVTAVELLTETTRAYFDIDGDSLLSRPRGEETTVRYVLTRAE